VPSDGLGQPASRRLRPGGMAEQGDAAALGNGEAGHAEDEQGPAEEEDLLDDLEDDEYVDEDVDVQVLMHMFWGMALPWLAVHLSVPGQAQRARV